MAIRVTITIEEIGAFSGLVPSTVISRVEEFPDGNPLYLVAEADKAKDRAWVALRRALVGIHGERGGQ